ncbi:BTAD domain-containing putative transcriptional regulator [Amycolatopsis sp. NPDC051045]|uniref:BTAD domain-containing putative transcriptional regulator n=1 Tax=Amycolatopsis sp. NPDC051045 TaxID=3156922 RepID=UPI00343FB157
MGPLELRVGGERVNLGPRKQQSVLAVLLFSVGRLVSVETLIDRVWGDAPPDNVRNTLYSYIARLRGLLRRHVPDFGDSVPLRRTTGGYLFDVPSAAIDYQRFRHLLNQARDSAIDDETRRSLLREALQEWHGTPLDGLTGEWVDGVRRRLEQYRITAAAEWAELESRLGDAGRVIDRLSELLSEYPLAEALVGRLVRALHDTGRSAEALETYAAARRRIVSELGTEPSAPLRALHQDILRTTGTPDASRPGEPHWHGPRPHLGTLIGRDDDQRALVRLLGQRRLVTVTGVGGCGKTALALVVAQTVARARRLAAVVLSLAAVTSARQIIHLARATLGGDAGDAGDDSLVTVERLLADRPTILVLDNCEHVAAEVAELVVHLLGNCAELTVLTTSRQPLSVSGEALFALEPLAVPPRGRPADRGDAAIALFVERVASSAPSVVVTDDDLEYIAEICRRLDGLPLALELVAARARTFAFDDLVNRLGHNMTLLFRTTTSSGSRHRTLEATLDWSFQLLSEPQRRLFVRLSAFASGFTANDAEAVCGFPPLDEDLTAATLAALVDRSLIQPYAHGQVRRYRMLEVIRNFAAERLQALDEQDVVRSRHLEHVLALAQHVDQLPHYHHRVAELRSLEADAANLRQCLEFGLRTARSLDAAEIVARLFEFWLVNDGYLDEGRDWLKRTLSVPGLGERPEVHALLRFHEALVAKLVDDELRGLELLRRVAGELARHRPREFVEASAAMLSAKLAVLDPSVLDEVEPTLARALRSAEHDDVLTVCNAATSVLLTWGRYGRALAISLEYDSRGVEPGASSLAALLTVRAEAALGHGDFVIAAEAVTRLQTLVGDVAHAAEQDSPRRVIGLYHLVVGRVDLARRFLDDTWVLLTATHPRVTPRFTMVRILLAEAQRRCGDPQAALRTLCGGLELATGRSQFRFSLSGVLEAALLAADLGDAAGSRELVRRWDTLRRELGLPVPICFAGVAGTLGLDPGPPAGHVWRWRPDAIHACVAGARSWCERTLPAAPRPDRSAR